MITGLGVYHQGLANTLLVFYLSLVGHLHLITAIMAHNYSNFVQQRCGVKIADISCSRVVVFAVIDYHSDDPCCVLQRLHSKLVRFRTIHFHKRQRQPVLPFLHLPTLPVDFFYSLALFVVLFMHSYQPFCKIAI